MNIYGYRRGDGRVGIRNHLVVLVTVHCASEIAQKIAAQLNAVPITHYLGCMQPPDDLEETRRILLGMGNHPNAGAVLVVGLGCEQLPARDIAAQITGRPLECLEIQKVGGTSRAVQRGVELGGKLVQHMSQLRREEAPLGELTMAVKCGGSDAGSGLASNPALGAAADRLIAAAGTVIQGEITLGVDHLWGRRAANEEVRRQIYAYLDGQWEAARRAGISVGEVNPTPGNIEGGLTTLIEKAIGGMKKGGSSPVQGLLPRGEQPPGRGLWLMHTTGPTDVFGITDQVAGGAQVVAFTSGRGNPVGAALAPVIKVTSTRETFCQMRDNFDFDASSILRGEESMEECGERLFQEVIAVANGKPTCNETMGHREFAIARRGET
ncbi:MAG: UxaA family hydrolase [Bacteroidetes bacterium]|nr:UxaA family hydrolase [Bacteroidota bacterium]